jgi:hypothetical protein
LTSCFDRLSTAPQPLLAERSPALRAGDLLSKSSVAVSKWRGESVSARKLHLPIESARMAPMDEIFQKIIDSNFSDLKGLEVDASIPVPQYMINEIIEAALQGNKNIDYCRVSIGGQNRVSVKLKTPVLPWPLDLKLKLFKSVDLARSPRIRASLENNLLLGKIGSFFKALPEGVKRYGNQVVLDIESFLSAPEQKKFLDLIKSAEINTEEGKVILDVKIRVDE